MSEISLCGMNMTMSKAKKKVNKGFGTQIYKQINPVGDL